MAKAPEKRELAAESAPEDSAIASEIARRIESIVPKGQQAQVIAQVVSVVQEQFSGPIAHPRHLAEYERIHPGSADRIIGMAERGLAHNQAAHMAAIEADIADTKSGRWFGFISLVLLIGCALACALFVNNVAAGLFLGAGALGVVGKMIDGRARNS